VLWPLFAGLFMVFIAIYSIKTFDGIASTLGIGGILLGFVPLLFSSSRKANAADTN
jgi:hypothetical protein